MLPGPRPIVKIRPKPNEPIARTLKRFKRLCENEGITRDYRRHEYYESPSQVKRRKRVSNKKRIAKEARELRQGDPKRKPDDESSGYSSRSFDS